MSVVAAWVFNDSVGACNCCSPCQAMEGGFWECRSRGQLFEIVEEGFMAGPHSAAACTGNCSQHPLMTPIVRLFTSALGNGESWGAIEQAHEEALLAKLGHAEKLRRANQLAATMLDINLGAEASQMTRHADKMAHVSSRLQGKKNMPCKFLYCPPGTKDVQVKNVCSDCWAWEQTDPRSKQRKTPRTCPYLHPGEAGWQTQWETDRFFRPEAVIGGRDFSALRGRSGGGKRF